MIVQIRIQHFGLRKDRPNPKESGQIPNDLEFVGSLEENLHDKKGAINRNYL